VTSLSIIGGQHEGRRPPKFSEAMRKNAANIEREEEEENLMEEILKMYESTFSDSNILRAAVGTTGFRGGDSSHGGRTFIELEDLAGTDIDFQVEKEGRLLKINLRGDAELRTILGAFQFISRTLERETQGPESPSQR